MKIQTACARSRRRVRAAALGLILLLVAAFTLLWTSLAKAETDYTGTYVLRSTNGSDMVMDVEGGVNSGKGSNIIQWTFHGGVNQQWKLTRQADGSYTIASLLATGYLMDVYGASVNQGVQIIQWPSNGGDNQKWLVRDNGDGSVTLESKKSGLVIDVYGGQKTAGTKLIQWPSHGGANQRWILEPVGSPATYTVSFDSNGGSAVAGQSVASGNLASKPADPVLAGFLFGGWYQDPGLTAPWDFSTNKVTKDLTLYAKWTAGATVAYDSNGGSTVAPTVVATGSLLTPPTPPVLAGKAFAGWFQDAALTDPWDFATEKVQGNMTLYAKWAVNAALADGLYSISPKASGLALDVYGGFLDNNVPIIQWNYSGNNNQIWNIQALTDGSCRIVSVKSGKVLENAADGTIVQNAWSSADNQKWLLQDAGSADYRIVSKGTGKALALETVSASTGVRLIAQEVGSGNGQLFKLSQKAYNQGDIVSPVQPLAGPQAGLYNVRSALNNLVVDIPDTNPRNGINMIQWNATGGFNQKFELQYLANGLYKFIPLSSGKPLTIPAGSVNGTKVSQWYDTGSNAAQYWELRQAGSSWNLIHSLTGLYLDVPASSTQSGTELIVYTGNGGANQKWNLEYAGETPNVKERTSGLQGKVIWLDPGHGRKYYSDDYSSVLFDPGASPAGKVAEYVNVVLAGIDLKAKLEAAGAMVLMTRTNTTADAAETVDTIRTYELRSRAYGASAIKADLFLSLHNNSAATTTANGVSTWYYLPDPADDPNYTGSDPRIVKSTALAGYLQGKLSSGTGFADYGVKGADFAVIRETRMPAVLMELGFLTNASDYNVIQNNRGAIVNAIFDGLVQYFNDPSCY